MIRALALAAVAAASFGASFGPARAEYPAPAGADGWARAESGRVAVRLIAAPATAGGLSDIRAALEVDLAPGWKTYWRSPGDAGLPPAFEWQGSTNFAAAAVEFPPPQRHTLLGIETVGYEGRTTFPLRIRPERPGEALGLRSRVHLLVCADVCVPEKFDLTLTLPAGEASPSPHAGAVAKAFAAVPGDGRAVGLRLETLEVDGATLRAVVVADPPLVAPDLFVETAEELPFHRPTLTPLGDGRAELRAAVTDRPGEPVNLAGAAVRLTLVDGDPQGGDSRNSDSRSGDSQNGGLLRAADFSAVAVQSAAPLSPPPAAPPSASPSFASSFAPAVAGAGGGLPAVLAIALLGGLILNVMPCVLPVLSLKLLSAVRYGGQAPAQVRAGFLATAAGVVVSFLALAAAAAGLKAAGVAVGWGMQFQQPLFLGFMIVVTGLFAANLAGLFEIPLPRFIADRFDGPEGGGAGGSFAAGAFAALLATPCSAPFLGTAVGFALAAATGEIFAVFTALGVGMASPYLLAAAFPGAAAALLPRPGRWMTTVRRVLAAALLGTAVWLGSVLAGQVGLLDRAEKVDAAGVVWVPFDEAEIARATAAGRVVFVDVTADWCVTCKANKKLVLDRGGAAAALTGPNVTAMRADWTRPDETIARYLARHGRYGVPFNAVYGPKAPQGLPLPELLTESAVLAAMAAAGL